VHERRPDRSAERGSPINENAAESEAPAVEQTGGQIGQAPFAQVGRLARVAVAELRDAPRYVVSRKRCPICRTEASDRRIRSIRSARVENERKEKQIKD
jgi:hypothetical protein